MTLEVVSKLGDGRGVRAFWPVRVRGVSSGEGIRVPRPEYVAGLLSIDMLIGLEAKRTPMWATWWLVQGRDGPELRSLAGLSGDDPFDVRDAARAALDEMGIPCVSPEEACRVVFDRWAVECLSGEIDERGVLRRVEDLYRGSGYEGWVLEQPLGAIYGAGDEWEGGWGRLENDLRAAVKSACQLQLAH